MRFTEYRGPEHEPDFTDLTVAVLLVMFVIGFIIALVEGKF